MRLADKLLLCAAGIYTALQCARILDHFYACFLWNTFLSAFSSSWLPSSMASCYEPILKRSARITKPLPDPLCVEAGLCPAHSQAFAPAGLSPRRLTKHTMQKGALP